METTITVNSSISCLKTLQTGNGTDVKSDITLVVVGLLVDIPTAVVTYSTKLSALRQQPNRTCRDVRYTQPHAHSSYIA